MIHEHGMLRFNVNFIDNRCWGWFTYSSICIRQIEHIFFVMLFCYKMPEARICGVWDRKKTLQFLTGCRVHFLISILPWITSRWTNFSFCITLFDNRNKIIRYWWQYSNGPSNWLIDMQLLWISDLLTTLYKDATETHISTKPLLKVF